MKHAFGIILVTASCAALAPSAGPLTGTASDDPMAVSMGPSHPATTPTQWEEIERVATRVASERAYKVGATHRLTNVGTHVTQRVSVKGGHCYVAGVAWAFGGNAAASVRFLPRPDGTLVNDVLLGTNADLTDGVGKLEFCADRSGDAELMVTAIGSSGAMSQNELLEYAVAVGSSAETAAQTKQRRSSERERAAASQARIDANVALAKARERENLRQVCSRCRTKRTSCELDNRRAAGRPGVSFKSNCEDEFDRCVGAGEPAVQACSR